MIKSVALIVEITIAVSQVEDVCRDVFLAGLGTGVIKHVLIPVLETGVLRMENVYRNVYVELMAIYVTCRALSTVNQLTVREMGPAHFARLVIKVLTVTRHVQTHAKVYIVTK